MRQRYPEGSAVWCKWSGGKEYAARVIKHDESRGEFRYKVHFTGWNSRHDEWTTESQLRINKNPVNDSPVPGPQRYSPEPECSSKKKNGKKQRKEEDRERVPEDRKGKKEESKELIIVKERMDKKPVKRKIEILSDIPPPPMKRSKAAREKYSPPPKTAAQSSSRGRGRPPKMTPAAFAATSSLNVESPTTSREDKYGSPRYRSRRYEDENEASASTTNRVLSPSTVRRRKRANAAMNGGLEMDEQIIQEGHRHPIDTHPPDMVSPTSTPNSLLSLGLDMYLIYGGTLESPEGRTRRNMHTTENKKEAIASIVENIKRREREIAEDRKRKLQWRMYLEFKRRLVKDFEQYLAPAHNNRLPSAQQPTATAPEAVNVEKNENECRFIKEDVKKEEDEGVKREVEQAGPMNGVVKEDKMEVEETDVKKKEEEEKSELPNETTTSSPAATIQRSFSLPSTTCEAPEQKEEEDEETAPADPSPSPAGTSSKTTPLTVSTTMSGASGGVTPSPSPILPNNLKPNPNVPQEQSYAHIPFVGAETARDVVSAMKAERAQQGGRGGNYLQQQAKTINQRSYSLNGNSMRSAASSSNGSRLMGRSNVFVAPQVPSYPNGKTPVLVQPKKLLHESDIHIQNNQYYGAPSTSSGGRSMLFQNGSLKREWYARTESVEFDDFNHEVVAEEVVMSEDMEMDGSEPGPSRTSQADHKGSSEMDADHCYGTTSAAKARFRDKQLVSSRDYSSSSPGGATMVSGSAVANGGTGMRQRIVVPRMYNGAPMLSSSSSSNPRLSLTQAMQYAAADAASKSSARGRPVYIGMQPPPTGVNNRMMNQSSIRFRPAPGTSGGTPILHNSQLGGGNVRLVDSRHIRPVYVRTTNGGTTSANSQSFGVAPTRVTTVGGNGGINRVVGGNGVRRVAYISPPLRNTTRLIIPKTGGGSGGVTMAAARGGSESAPTSVVDPPILVPETAEES